MDKVKKEGGMDKIKAVLWDIDGTVLDFEKSEKTAVRRGFSRLHLGECTDEMLSDYSAINQEYWRKLERGELEKDTALVLRFADFFERYGIDRTLAGQFNKSYQDDLSELFFYNDHALEILTLLKGKVKQYAVTNGTAAAQENKLRKSGLADLFDDVFISEKIGVEKPGKGFFDEVFRRIGEYRRSEIMIVGDSLTSDMKGGNNAGILCCWYNPQRLKNEAGVRIDREIASLRELSFLI